MVFTYRSDIAILLHFKFLDMLYGFFIIVAIPYGIFPSIIFYDYQLYLGKIILCTYFICECLMKFCLYIIYFI